MYIQCIFNTLASNEYFDYSRYAGTYSYLSTVPFHTEYSRPARAYSNIDSGNKTRAKNQKYADEERTQSAQLAWGIWPWPFYTSEKCE